MTELMKYILPAILVLLSLNLNAQALDPEKAFANQVKATKDIPTLFTMAQEAREKEFYARYEQVVKRLTELSPFNPNYRFALARAYALQDKKSEAYNELINLQREGLSYPVGDQEGFDKIKGTGAYDYIEENMVANANAFGEGETVFTVSENYSGMLFENIAFDQAADRFLLGSIRSGAIYEYTDKGGFKEFIKPADIKTGPWGIIDLVIDNQAGVLWTASATLPHYTGTTPNNFGHAMISKFKLSTGELLNNFAMGKTEQPMLFNGLHLSAQQNLYFINAFSSDFFKIAKDGDAVEQLLSLPGLKNIKALTTNSDESILYFSDYEMGLFVINMETKQVAPMVKNGEGFYGGINDLFYEDGDLVIIQSGVNPARLMRLVLTDDLLLKTKFPIEASHPKFKSLGNGFLLDGDVYYAANSQWAKTDGLGRLLPETMWEPLLIMKTDSKFRMEDQMLQIKQIEEIKRKRGMK